MGETVIPWPGKPTPCRKWFQPGSCAHMVSLVGEIQNCRQYQATVVPCVRLLVRLAAISDNLALRTVLSGLLNHLG